LEDWVRLQIYVFQSRYGATILRRKRSELHG
jgi:hypothetical protein